jgi:hypothetical protein
MAQQLVGAEENGQELRVFVGPNPCPTKQWSGLGKSWRFSQPLTAGVDMTSGVKS